MIEENGLTVLTDTDDLYGSGICDKVLTIQTFMNNSGVRAV